MKEIIYLYPESFELDLLNKYKFWMAIPKLPLMNIKLIKEFYNKYKKKISDEDKKYNTLEKIPFYN